MSATIEIKDVGPVEHLSIPVPEGGGLVVLRGRNGAGKTHSLDAVTALVAGKGKVPSRRGSLGARVEGLGARLTMTRRADRAGEVEVSHLEGEDPSLFVDPGIKDPGAADAARIRALLRLSGAQVDVGAFAKLVDGQDRLEALCKPASLSAREDVTAMASAIKRDLESAARKAEGERDNAFAKADGVRATLKAIEAGPGSERRTGSPEEAREAHTRAVKEHAALEARQADADGVIQAAEDARAALAEFGDDGTPEAVEAAKAADEQAQRDFRQAEDAFKAAERALDQARVRRDRAVGDHSFQYRQHRQRAALDQSVKAADGIRPIPDEDVEALARAIASSEDELGAWKLHERTQTLREQIKAHDEAGRAASEEAAKLRDAARGTEGVVIETVRAVCGDDMELHEGRLYVKRGNVLEPFSDLSDGERWRRALDVAVNAVGAKGLLVVRQEAYQHMQPSKRREVHELARERGVVILTAGCDDGELRAELEAS